MWEKDKLPIISFAQYRFCLCEACIERRGTLGEQANRKAFLGEARPLELEEAAIWRRWAPFVHVLRSRDSTCCRWKEIKQFLIWFTLQQKGLQIGSEASRPSRQDGKGTSGLRGHIVASGKRAKEISFWLYPLPTYPALAGRGTSRAKGWLWVGHLL